MHRKQHSKGTLLTHGWTHLQALPYLVCNRSRSPFRSQLLAPHTAVTHSMVIWVHSDLWFLSTPFRHCSEQQTQHTKYSREQYTLLHVYCYCRITSEFVCTWTGCRNGQCWASGAMHFPTNLNTLIPQFNPNSWKSYTCTFYSCIHQLCSANWDLHTNCHHIYWSPTILHLISAARHQCPYAGEGSTQFANWQTASKVHSKYLDESLE